MKFISRFTALIVIVVALGFADSAHGQYGVWYGPPRGYVYYPPTTWVAPPYATYYYPAWYPPAFRAFGPSLPPYGFGSPYYNGYNDPYAYQYGPGVRQFLRFGGADFYGW
jgi:hypothetical protein